MGYSAPINLNGRPSYNEIGLPATVLTLQWPPGVVPAQLPDFETQARRLRYQALGTACRDRLISSLFLAHHEDDQAETIFLRLVRGHKDTGLQGMQPVADISECHGIYGVDRSGTQEIKAIQTNRRIEKYNSSHDLSHNSNAPLIIEEGGVKIYRPLLRFSKERLVETCRATYTRWMEDETNQDPTTTPRNAVRSILNTTKLPRSLQKPSLLALGKSMAERANARTRRAKQLFEACDISMLDTRSGSLVVRLPDQIPDKIETVPPAYRQKRLFEGEHLAALMLRQLLKIVTPQKHVPLQSLQFAVHTLYPRLKEPTATSLERHSGPSRFTAGSVTFTRVLSSLERSNGEQDSGQHPRKWGPFLDEEFIWVLTRQPFYITPGPSHPESKLISWGPPAQSPVLATGRPHRFPNSSGLNLSDPAPSIPEPSIPEPYNMRDFRLWDSRYWFLIHNPTPFTLLVRSLRIANLRQLRASLHPAKAKTLDKLLRDIAPGKIRYTLPVLVRKDTEQDRDTETERETVLALPTLRCDFGAKKLGVRWEVRYRGFDLGHEWDRRKVIL